MSWPTEELGSLCKLVNGDRGKNYPSKDALLNVGIPFINAGNLTEDHLVLCSGLNYISEEHFSLLSNGKVQDGDILFCLRGSLGKFAVVDSSISQGAVASSLVIIRPNEKIDANYLKNYFKSNLCIKEISRFKNGAAQPNLSAKDLQKFEIPLPPLKEQKRIASILDKADAIRRKRHQAIQLADEFLRATFLDMFGDPYSNHKRWDIMPLNLLGKAITGSTPSSKKVGMWGNSIPFVTPGDLNSNLGVVSRWLTVEGAKNSRVCRSGSLMACCIGTVGKVGMARQVSAFNQQINAVEWNEKIDDFYGYAIFKFFPELISANAIQTTVPILKKSLFEMIKIPVPEITLQKKFRLIFEHLEKNRERWLENFENEMFLSLSQKAFSGQL